MTNVINFLYIKVKNYILIIGDRIKKRKRKKNKRIIIFNFTILLLAVSFILYKSTLNIDTHGYQKETYQVFKELNIVDKIIDKDYSKTLEKIINTEYFDSKYIDEYININYKEEDNFIEQIYKLLNIGYKSNDINTIYNKLKTDNIELITSNNYMKDLTNMLNLTYFKNNNLERYIKYYLNNNYNYIDVITYVNIGLDNDYYTNTKLVDNENDITLLVNKYNYLNENYVPNDLTLINPKYTTRENKLRAQAASSFEALAADALKDGIKIYAASSYRSYSYQKNLYNYYVSIDGIEEADTYSARPGFSEHQTGLAVDIANINKILIEENDKEFTWLKNNAHKYGFILRYQKSTEKITGYIYEPWHYRYVGTELASYIYSNNITYDEYIARNK